MSNRNLVYMSYGLIMKELQNTELLMTQSIYIINLKKGKIKSAEKASKIYKTKLESTFGQLVKMFGDLNPESEFKLEQQYFDELNNIKDLRNVYAHSFFKEFPSFNTDDLIQEIIESNEFVFKKIQKSNLVLKEALIQYLKNINHYSKEDIKKMTSYFSEKWDSLIK